MDLRAWQWRSPWEKRTYLFCSLFYLCLLLRQHVTAVETGYSQESKHDVPDSTKLDSLSSYLPFDSREDTDYKRGSAFFPLRGKKPSDDALGHQLYMPESEDSEDKRSQFFPLRGKKVPDDLKRASYFMPMRGRKDDGWIDEDYDVTDESPNKRASSFMPMRGKKKYAAISDYLRKAGTYSNDVSQVLNPSNSDSYRTSDKRMHSFVPVRGKRSYKEPDSPHFQVSSANESHEDVVSNHSAMKRSVSFMPMRGRREFESSEAEAPGEIATSLLEKKLSSFMPMRGRKDGGDFGSVDKKATFMPMRGRRYDDDENSGDSEDDPESKRAQSFMPMRGRRTHLRDVVFESSDTPEIESRLIEDKRASSFMPMRGRRSLSDENIASESDLNKRPSSFTLMRGRRSIGYVENEDVPEDPLDTNKRVAFMPMRGRRLVDEDFEVEPWPTDQLMPLLDKKSSAFMPMRGRRFHENITVDPWPAEQLMSLFNKRSSAFMPMRGRRFNENITVDPWPAEELMSLFNKRSSAFMPMRGRRFHENITVDPWPAEQLMSLFNKKSTFMPMRGRRSGSWDYDTQDSDDADYNENWGKRSSSFMPMRGRRLDVGGTNFYNPYPYLMAGMGSSLMSKPYSDQGMSFYSVGSANERRKKLRINWDAVKRAFHATRGKRFQEADDFADSLKDNYSSGADDALADDSKHTRTKRSIIRQRVAIQPNRQYIALKRPMSFFATRGKRLDDSAIDKLSKLR